MNYPFQFPLACDDSLSLGCMLMEDNERERGPIEKCEEKCEKSDFYTLLQTYK